MRSEHLLNNSLCVLFKGKFRGRVFGGIRVRFFFIEAKASKKVSLTL